jgi:hypothetical protein
MGGREDAVDFVLEAFISRQLCLQHISVIALVGKKAYSAASACLDEMEVLSLIDDLEPYRVTLCQDILLCSVEGKASYMAGAYIYTRSPTHNRSPTQQPTLTPDYLDAVQKDCDELLRLARMLPVDVVDIKGRAYMVAAKAMHLNGIPGAITVAGEIYNEICVEKSLAEPVLMEIMAVVADILASSDGPENLEMAVIWTTRAATNLNEFVLDTEPSRYCKAAKALVIDPIQKMVSAPGASQGTKDALFNIGKVLLDQVVETSRRIYGPNSNELGIAIVDTLGLVKMCGHDVSLMGDSAFMAASIFRTCLATGSIAKRSFHSFPLAALVLVHHVVKNQGGGQAMTAEDGEFVRSADILAKMYKRQTNSSTAFILEIERLIQMLLPYIPV